MSRSLEDWDAAGKLIMRVYVEELGRACDFGGAINWLVHWREGDHGAGFEDWLRARFRESEEWRQRHGASPPPMPPPDVPPTPEPPATTSEPPGAVRVYQVTSPEDGTFVPRMYCYWPNAYVTGATAYVFAGHDDGRPRFFSVDLASGAVSKLGPLVSYTGTTEGWYWDREGWIYSIDGPRLRRTNPFSGQERLVFDITDRHPGCRLWQAHSSDDGRTHAATVEQIVSEGAYPRIGTAVFRNGRHDFFEAQGTLDESAITPDGAWLVIKETLDDGLSNRVINLDTRETRLIRDSERALGHSDCGPGYMAGEADKPDPGMCGWWDLTGPLTPDRFRGLFPTLNMGYVAVRGDRILHSSDTQLRLVDRFTGAITILMDHGGGTGYDDRVKANLSPDGRVACFMSKMGRDRFDVFLAVLPA